VSSHDPQPGPPVSGFPRRIFLQRSLQLAGLVTLLPWIPSGCGKGKGRGDPSLKTFSAEEYEIARAVGDTFIPEGGAFAVGSNTVDLARRLDAFLVDENERVIRSLAGALWTLEYGGILLAGHVGRFTRMSPHRRRTYFEKLPLGFATGRAIYSGLKRTFVFLFYTLDPSWAPLGYDGTWTGSPPPAWGVAATQGDSRATAKPGSVS
jgi:hypothetical protein